MDILKLHTWHEKAKQLKKLKAEEAELRRDICNEFLEGQEMHNGRASVTYDIDGFGWKAVQTLSYSLDVAVLETIYNELNDAEKMAIVLKPSLSLAAYKKLPEDSLLHEAVITRLAMPTLTAEWGGE